MKPKWTVRLSDRQPGWYKITDDLDCIVADCICSDRDAQKMAEAPDMAGALKRLANEVSANLGPFETDLRAAIGNTNFAVLLKRVAEARALLARIEKETT